MHLKLNALNITLQEVKKIQYRRLSSIRYIIQLYSKTYLKFIKNKQFNKTLPINRFVSNIIKKQMNKEQRGYLKRIIRLRYRWFFRPKLRGLKLFKIFFKRNLKRYRKIHKNKLFVKNFRANFSRIVGLNEIALLKTWNNIRRGYNQYWSYHNAVQKFTVSLALTLPNLLVFLRAVPSISAGKYLIKSGGVYVNSQPANIIAFLKPGDIMQLNVSVWKATKYFFNYQRWPHNKVNWMLHFLYIDWSSMVTTMTRWPRRYELITPSYLSDRWIRYYIRLFPAKIAKYKKAWDNLNVYKRIINKK